MLSWFLGICSCGPDDLSDVYITPDPPKYIYSNSSQFKDNRAVEIPPKKPKKQTNKKDEIEKILQRGKTYSIENLGGTLHSTTQKTTDSSLDIKSSKYIEPKKPEDSIIHKVHTQSNTLHSHNTNSNDFISSETSNLLNIEISPNNLKLEEVQPQKNTELDKIPQRDTTLSFENLGGTLHPRKQCLYKEQQTNKIQTTDIDKIPHRDSTQLTTKRSSFEKINVDQNIKQPELTPSFPSIHNSSKTPPKVSIISNKTKSIQQISNTSPSINKSKEKKPQYNDEDGVDMCMASSTFNSKSSKTKTKALRKISAPPSTKTNQTQEQDSDDDDGVDMCMASSTFNSKSSKTKTKALRKISAPPSTKTNQTQEQDSDDDDGVDMCMASSSSLSVASHHKGQIRPSSKSTSFVSSTSQQNCFFCHQNILTHQTSLKFNSSNRQIICHKSCMKCYNCSTALSASFSVVDEHIYCPKCIPNPKSTTKTPSTKNCAACSFVLDSKSFFSRLHLGTFYFHQSCFNCYQCKKAFHSPATSIMCIDNHWFCDSCTHKWFIKKVLKK